jgi:hypothetical protein
MINHISPKWNIEEVKNLKYVLTTYKGDSTIAEYVNAGHERSMISLYNYHEPNIMPNFMFDYVKPQFYFLDKVCLAINYFKPGQYLPPHSDLYGKYLQVNDANPQKIVRFILMLEDSSDGQIIQIKKSCFGSWKSGDCFYWEYDDLHAFYNFSLKDRYAVQITGVIK